MVVVGILGLHSANINISEDYDAQLITEAGILWEIMEEDSKDERMSAFALETFDAEHTADLLESVGNRIPCWITLSGGPFQVRHKARL